MAEEGEGSRKFVVFRINRRGWKKKLGTPLPARRPSLGCPSTDQTDHCRRRQRYESSENFLGFADSVSPCS